MATASSRKRRVAALPKDSSSREGSEESNADNDINEEDDSASLTDLSRKNGDGFDRPTSSLATTAISNARRTHRQSSNPTALRPVPEKVDDNDPGSSTTYDGDISSAPAGTSRSLKAQQDAAHSVFLPRTVRPQPSSSALSTSTASPPSSSPPSPVSGFAQPRQVDLIGSSSPERPVSPSPQTSPSRSHPIRDSDLLSPSSSVAHPPAPHGLISKISPQELQATIRGIIDGNIKGPDGATRLYKINPPPIGRPVRIYADGVYDLFHYAHALQLRQAKLFFPEVELLVGVCSDELVLKYKAHPVLNSEERYESVRNCKWVDEVIEDAPWTIDEAFLEKHRIDYVAHDEEPYVSAGSSDVYAPVKALGKFLPTRRTSGISTSELLSRIVEGYRGGDYDNKFEKIGRSDIMSRPGSEAGSRRDEDDSLVNSLEALPDRVAHGSPLAAVRE